MNFEMRKSRPKSQIMTLDNSSPPPPPQRKNGSLPQQQRWYENDGELKERQLTELKTRMRQMEKTMRWWSDCATNWREKWSQLRLERNKVKEELKSTQIEFEKITKELEYYKGSGLCTPTTPGGGGGRIIEASQSQSFGVKNKRAQTDPVDYLKSDEVMRLEKTIARYLLRLEEANRTIIAEREDKVILHHTVERLQRDLQDLQELYDNLKKEMYELKDYSEMDESFGGDRDDVCLSDEDLNFGAIGYNPVDIENGKESPVNYQTSLLIELSDRKCSEVSPPVLQIVEEFDSKVETSESPVQNSEPQEHSSTTLQVESIEEVKSECNIISGDNSQEECEITKESDNVARSADTLIEVLAELVLAPQQVESESAGDHKS